LEMQMGRPIRVLILEDTPTDAELCRREISRTLPDCRFLCVETGEEYTTALEQYEPDVIISDYKLPSFDGMMALELARRISPYTPFIILTGSMNEDVAVECMKAGAWDYVIKEHIKRLGASVVNALEEKSLRLARHRAEEALRESEQRYRALFEKAPNPILMIDMEGNYINANDAALQFLECTSEELLAKNVRDTLPAGDDVEERFKQLTEMWRTGGRLEREYMVNGKVKVLDLSITPFNWKGEPAVFGIGVDITERRQTEEAILKSKMLLQTVVDSTPDWICVKDRRHRYLLVNRSFAMAMNLEPRDMVGRADTDFFPEELCIGNEAEGAHDYHGEDDIAFLGHTVYHPAAAITWPDGTVHIYDVYRIPLRDEKGQIYAVLVYHRDITERQKAEDERKQSYLALEKAFDDIILAMAKVVEMKDPYTAGHQTRVAELSAAIAGEMGLSEEQVRYIRTAALIHDIGKIYVPSDILSKPGKLSPVEWELIRTHARGSYDILSKIEFPWPIAQIALQHHERLDGSGYPRGLKDDEIMLEARILAVADVVEAMVSHRPYRAALGMDAAIEELEQKKGILYDPRVVDICLKLLREKGDVLQDVHGD